MTSFVFEITFESTLSQSLVRTHLAAATTFPDPWRSGRLPKVKLFTNCVGDVALGGRKLSEEEGHFNDNRKPSGFDTKQIFVSPSVRYSGHNCYAKIKR